MIARSARPMSREISCVRPPILPFTDSLLEREFVDRGSIAYSAVTQPRPEPLRQRGTPSVNEAVHSTRVPPNSTSTDPSAWSDQPRWNTTGRSWSGRRPSARVMGSGCGVSVMAAQPSAGRLLPRVAIPGGHQAARAGRAPGMVAVVPRLPPAMPAVPISLLDRSRTRSHERPEDSLRATVHRAERAEKLGYHRFWVAEHHGVPGIASAAPTVLMAAVAAATSTIRVGSGGVMLLNHQPLVVAEQARTLAALHPGRIDLGIGRSLGFTSGVRKSLRVTEYSPEAFDADLDELLAH